MLHLEYILQIHQEEIQKQAEHYRLLAQARQFGDRRRGYHRLVFNWLGNRMIQWGDRLLERSGDSKPVPVTEL
jgi:hypothetical protein